AGRHEGSAPAADGRPLLNYRTPSHAALHASPVRVVRLRARGVTSPLDSPAEGGSRPPSDSPGSISSSAKGPTWVSPHEKGTSSAEPVVGERALDAPPVRVDAA